MMFTEKKRHGVSGISGLVHAAVNTVTDKEGRREGISMENIELSSLFLILVPDNHFFDIGGSIISG